MGYKWTKHPIIPIPTQGQLLSLMNRDGHRAVYDLWEKREHAIKMSLEDPVNHGIALPQQEEAEEILKQVTELWIFGGNRSSKSYTCAKMVMKALMKNPGTRIVCWAQNQDTSIETQQPYLHQMLPKEYQYKCDIEKASINYNDKSGFTANKFVMPNGSSCLFRFYSQFANNPNMIEGHSFGANEEDCEYLNIGAWMDEYYLDDTLVKKMYRRCTDNNSKILVSFTPLYGYTPTVASVLKGSKIDKTLYGEIIGKEMPYVITPRKVGSKAIFFHTERNPFTNKDRLKQDLANESEEEIMKVAYGYPVNSITTNFPQFSEAVNVINELPRIDPENWTVYQVIDPADARNFFVIWAAVNSLDDVIILREWPDRDTYGEWAIPAGDNKWKYSSGAKKRGYAVSTDVKEYSYVELFKEIEEELGVEVYERVGDSRFMAREPGSSDMFTDFYDKGMDVRPSDGRTEAEGIQLLDGWFTYNPNIEMDSINKPKIKIHASCKNLICSIVNYAMKDKRFEPLKDPIDCLRYLRTINRGDGPRHYTKSQLTSAGTTQTWGY